MLERYFRTKAALTDHVMGKPLSGAYPPELMEIFSDELFNTASSEITNWSGYGLTPLRSLDRLANALGINAVHYKDESGRFGLGSFKALGGAYAVMRVLSAQTGLAPSDIRAGAAREAVGEVTVAAATDGNHGRSVAWGAGKAGCQCRIYIHRGVSDGRRRAMEELGATVTRTAGDYDDSVRVCARDAAAHAWHVVSDTAYTGYDQIPRDVMAGYGLMVTEILSQLPQPPSHMILQAGVGGLAAALAARFWLECGEQRPRLMVVEADRAPSLLKSARIGKLHSVSISEETIMAGLSCGEVSPLAWEVLWRCADHFVTVADDFVAPAMRCLASGELGGGKIEGGECSTAGLIALIAIATNQKLRGEFSLDQDSQVLLIGSEGATDPDIYHGIVAAE